MTFEPPRFQRTQTEREDLKGRQIHNESSKLPGHEERMQEHTKKVKREYFEDD